VQARVVVTVLSANGYAGAGGNMTTHNNLRLSAYLTRSLNHEMAAVQQYLMQSRLAALWGMSELSTRLNKDAGEELGHAGQLMQRMLELGIPSNATQLAPVRPGRSVEEMLMVDREIEIEVIRLYEEASHYCARVRDNETQILFARLLQDELGHLRDIDQQLTRLTKE
jgi:bacterioferritin